MYTLIVVVFSILALWFYRWTRSYSRNKILIDQFSGPKAYPIIGNCLELQHETTADYFAHMKSYGKLFNAKIVRVWLFNHAFLLIFGAKEAEAIFTSTKNIQKGRQYNLLHPWLKMGLLTSYGEKWRGRRKLLTPTFHYDILKDFLVVFNKQAEILVNILSKQMELRPRVNVSKFLTLCTLDIIVETAMGQSINSQENGDSDYVTAVHKATEIVFDATRKPWCWNKRLFQLIGRGKEFQECLHILLTYSRKVRRLLLKEEMNL
uniref:Cytochrome P450 n=1 Tax=Romanomermis culicivorax TaxID=13658 RepID=A0A915ISX8_ROMCU